MNSFIERRVFPSLALREPVLLRTESHLEPLAVHGVNVSHSGVCLNIPLDAPLAKGNEVRVNLPRPTEYQPETIHKFAWY